MYNNISIGSSTSDIVYFYGK